MPKGKGTLHFLQLSNKQGAFTMQQYFREETGMKIIKENINNRETMQLAKYILWYFSWISTKY